MKLTVFGATDSTGQQLVEQALAAGHAVIAFVREPSKLPIRYERLTIVQGELTDPTAIERAVTGADAVISALGPRRDVKHQPISRGTQNILVAMKKRGVRRFILSSTPSARDPNDAPDFKFKFAVWLIRVLARAPTKTSSRRRKSCVRRIAIGRSCGCPCSTMPRRRDISKWAM